MSVRFLVSLLLAQPPHSLSVLPTNNSNVEKSPAFLEEATEPRYVVEVSSIPKKKTEEEKEEAEGASSPPPSSSAFLSKKKTQRRTVHLADRAGRPFECSIPAVAAADEEGGDDNNNSGSDLPSPVSLLRSLEGTCLYRVEDSWWTFELCFERHVRQFHREGGGSGTGGGAGGVASEFWLGKWESGAADPATADAASSPPSPSSVPPSHYNVSISGGGADSFVSSIYSGGDPCDLLGGKPRRTEVKFVCLERPAPTAAPQQPPPTQPEGGSSSSPPPTPPAQLVQPPPNAILSAKELSTCSYEVVVGVDALCRHRGFREAEPATATIECRPVVAE